MKGEKVVKRICKIMDLDGDEEIEFVKQYVKDKVAECFPDRAEYFDWDSSDMQWYLEKMIEEYEKNVNDALRKGFSREVSKVIGLITVDRAIEIAKEKRDSVLSKGFYFGSMF